MLNFRAFSQAPTLIKQFEISSGLSPKSVVASPNGIFAAQNMMYRHTVVFFDAKGKEIAEVEDKVSLSQFGFSDYPSTYRGAPVEAAFTADGKFLWTSNYHMTGEGFEHPGCDGCHGTEFDNSFLYKINTTSYEIEQVVEVGAVPKFLAISPDQKLLLVSNWSSGDVSVVDLVKEKEVDRISVGYHPRGIAITSDSKTAFIAVMGSNKLVEIDLSDFSTNTVAGIGRAPRHVLLGRQDSVLYISMNSGSEVVQYNRFTSKQMHCKTARGPRSMCLSKNGQFLYVVNYFEDIVSKIETQTMQVVETVETDPKPIGICGNWDDSEIWVACYSGSIQVFKDETLAKTEKGMTYFTTGLGEQMAYQTLKKGQDEIAEAPTEKDTPNIALTADTVERKYQHQPQCSKQFQRTKTTESDCIYHLITGAFSQIDNAEKRKKELLSKGYPAQIIKGKLNYVSVNCFTTKSDAESAMPDVLTKTGYTSWVLKR